MWGHPLLDEVRKSFSPACCTSSLLLSLWVGVGVGLRKGEGGGSAIFKAPVGASLFFCPSKLAIGNLFFFFFFKTPCVRSSRSVRLRIRVVELLVLVEAVVVADVVEAAVGAVLVAQRRQAVEGGALGGAGGGGGGGGGVVVHGTEGQGGGRRGAGGHRHHGGQDEGQAVGHVFVGGASQGRSVT